MQKIRTETLERALRFFLFAALFAPAVFLPWLAHPFTFGKMSYFMLAVALAAASFALLLARGAFAPRAPAFLKMLFVYYAALALAAIFGVSSARSFWAESERMTGLVTGIFLLMFLFMLAAAVRTNAHWRRVFAFSAFTGLIVAASALLELVSPFMRHLFGDAESVRLSGPIGNPIYLGVYLLPIVGIMVLLAHGARNRRIRAAWIAAALFSVTVVAQTGSRGAGLGFATGTLCALVAGSLLAKTVRTRVAFLVATVLTVAFFGGIYAIARAPVGARAPAIHRLVSYNMRDFGPRRLNWEMALQGIRARPLLGWGQENYLYVFDRYYRPELLRYGPVEASSDKPHNGFLEIAVAGGLGALALYLGVLAIFGASLVRGARRGAVPVAAAVVGIGVSAGFLFSLFFGFETPAPLIPLYTLFAYYAFLLTRSRASAGIAPDAPTAFFGAAAGLAAVVLLAFYYVGVVRAVPSFTAAARATEAAYRNPTVFADAYRRATALRHPYSNELIRELTRDFILWEGRGTYPEKAVAAALPMVAAAVDRAIAREPDNFILQYERGQIALIAKDYPAADAALARAGELSPRRQAVTYMRAKILLLTGRPSEATALLKSLVDADPMVGQSHWFYALALVEIGERMKALEEFELSRETGRGMTTREKLYFIDLLAAEGLYEFVADIYEGLAESEPAHPLWHARLAATYAAMGKVELAIFEAERAAEIDPSYASTRDEFIQKLPKQ